MSRKRRNRSEIGELLDGADSNESVLSGNVEEVEKSLPRTIERTAKTTRVRIVKKRVRGRSGIYEMGSEMGLDSDEAGELIEKGLAVLA
jgi:hypothetical protein